MNEIIEAVEAYPIIGAIRKEADMEDVMQSGVRVVFLLQADIFNIHELVKRIKGAGKKVFVHMDFIEGLGNDHKALDYIMKAIKPDGIISTRSAHIKYVKKQGVFTIQRFFMIDSLSYETAVKTVKSIMPDMVEVMPGVIPGVIKRLSSQIFVPIIAGGLVDKKNDIIEVIKAGALGVSTGKKELWDI